MILQRRFPKLSLVLSVALLYGPSTGAQTPRSVQEARPEAVQRERGTNASEVPSQEKPESEEQEKRREREELEPDDPNGRSDFRRLQLQDEQGEIPVDGMEKARRHVALMKAEKLKRLKAGVQIEADPQIGILAAGVEPDSWTWLGPGNVGGRIRSIVIHPTNTNLMWIGSVSGGIWATQNGENPRATWFPVNDFLANLAVSTMIINPATPSTMYAGTGEGFGNVDALQGAGVFQSLDTGFTWNRLASTNPATAIPPGCGLNAAPCPAFWTFVNRLAISPNGGTILAATSQAFDVNGNQITTGGIARSTNSGATWIQETATQAFDVDFQPGDNNRALAGGEGGAMFRTLSPAGAPTWTAATFNPVVAAHPAPPTGRFQRRVEVAYAPRYANTIYAVVNQHQGGGVYQGEVYRITNGGQTFTRVHMGTNFFIGAGNQGWYDNALWVNPMDPTFIIVGGIWLWRSTDSGGTFTQISDGNLYSGDTASPHADNHIIVAHPGFNNNTNQRVFIGNDGGIYRTDIVRTANVFNGWGELNNQLGITQFYGAAGNAASGVIVGGTQDNGTLRFTGGTEGWTSMNGSDGGYCASDPTDPMFFYGETQNLGVVRSTNGGVSASPISAGIADAGVAGATNFIAPLILDPNEPNTLLAGGISLWRSQNAKALPPAAPTWVRIKNATPGNPISAIAVSPITSSLILVGHNDGSIFRSLGGTLADPTGTWTKIDTAILPNRMVTRLVIDTTRGVNWIYATFGGFGGDNIWRSTDNGASWADVTGTGATGLPSVPVRTLAFHPFNSNLLYAGSEIGIFTSEDAGTTWEPTQDGPANVSVDELFWMGGDLIAATHGRGLYRASGGVYVRCNYVGPEDGSIGRPFNTVIEAVNMTTRFRPIWILAGGNCNEQIRIDKRLELRSLGGPVIIGRP